MKNDRLFQILYILLERGTVTAPELAGLLEVSVRTVYRDVETLSMAGVPVYAAAGRGGGISLLSGYTFDKALLSDEEQNQILFAIQSLQAADRPVGTLLKKLGAVFQKQSANWIEVDFSRWGLGRVDHERFELLKTAILQKRVLDILYCGASGDISRREVKPFKLIFKDKSWYLRAFCLRARDFRLFKISRIMELSLTGDCFTEVFSDAPPLESEQPQDFPIITLRLRFSPAAAFRVYDEFDRGWIEKQPDGSLLVTAGFPAGTWIMSYLLSFGTQAEIVEPPWLRAQIAAYAKKIYEHHKT